MALGVVVHDIVIKIAHDANINDSFENSSKLGYLHMYRSHGYQW